MTEDELRVRIDNLEMELERNESEILGYLDKIDNLEETVMRLDLIIPEIDGKKKGKKSKDSKLVFELEEKEKGIRELKDRMGFLRKEKIQLQREFESYKRQQKGTVIRIEEKKVPFEALTKDLQSKINKQQTIIERLKRVSRKEDVEDLHRKIAELEKKLENTNHTNIPNFGKPESKSYTKEIQKSLIKSDKKVKSLEKQLAKIKAQSKNRGKNKKNSKIRNYENLKKELKEKNSNIAYLNLVISNLKEVHSSDPANPQVKGQMSDLTVELQRKLNKAKVEIKEQKEKINYYKVWKGPAEGNSQDEIIRELRIKLESLSKQEQLKKDLSPSNGKANEEIEEDPQLSLRLRELKNVIEELRKQNIQQRLEISRLRKK